MLCACSDALPPVLPRTTWTHQAPSGGVGPTSLWNRITLHQTGTYLAPGASCTEALKVLLERDTTTYGFKDVGIHYLVCPDGTVYQGTYGPINTLGFHQLALLTRTGLPDPETLGLSQGSVGIAWVGQFSYAQALALDNNGKVRTDASGKPVFELNRATPESLLAGARLIAWIAQENQIDLASTTDGAALTVANYRQQAIAHPYTVNGVLPALASSQLVFEMTGGRGESATLCTSAEVTHDTGAGAGPCQGKKAGEAKGAGYAQPTRYLPQDDPGEEILIHLGALRQRALALLGKPTAFDPSAPIDTSAAAPSAFIPPGYTRAPLGLSLRSRSEYARWRQGDTLPAGAQVGDVIPFNGTPSYRNWKHVVIHHSAFHTPATDLSACTAEAEAVFREHRFNSGFSDVGYNFLVCPDGTVYTGRNDGAKQTQGAHAFGFNPSTVGIVVLGQFSSASAYAQISGRKGLNSPTPAAMESLGKLIAWLSLELNSPLDGLTPGSDEVSQFGDMGVFRPKVALPFIGWHGLYAIHGRGYGNFQEDFLDYYYFTECPGDAERDVLGRVREIAEKWRALY